ncbi:MAG: serine--tRNA ligase [Gammaproteobacteria bacterium]|nr:MAG: serine--tRNA ligase [Gammaproteobacteria bacterium]
MLDLKRLKKDPKSVADNLKKRGFKLDLDEWTNLETSRKSLQSDTENLQAELNEISKEIGIHKKEGSDSSKLEKKAGEITSAIKSQSKDLTSILDDIDKFITSIPNLIDDDVPEGKDEEDNLELRTSGDIRNFDFTPKDHLELGSNLGVIDMESGVKITGARFAVLNGDLARLQRSLINFMIDIHTKEHNYEEVYVPYIVNSESLFGTGQLPKFEEDLFKLEGKENFYLTSTAEVPVTNLFRDEILNSKVLPAKFVCHTPCFRSEAGSYGLDTKGVMRLHQFEKVELVQAVEDKDSDNALEELTGHAEEILKRLELPYRVVTLCSGDIGFSAAKTYDIEVWIPSQDKYREISSCSNFRDFQARRMKARWKNPSSNKTELLNTLNGSGLALSRTVLAIMENFQQKDGSITIPEALRDYFGSDKISS